MQCELRIKRQAPRWQLSGWERCKNVFFFFFFQSSVVPQPVSGEFSIISSLDFQRIHAMGVGPTHSHKIARCGSIQKMMLNKFDYLSKWHQWLTILRQMHWNTRPKPVRLTCIFRLSNGPLWRVMQSYNAAHNSFLGLSLPYTLLPRTGLREQKSTVSITTMKTSPWLFWTL